MTEAANSTELVPDAIRNKLALALDVDDLVAAGRLARDLRPYFGVAKVGLELFSAAGPDIFGVLIDAGYKVFADLKLHDIPTTVNKASQVLGSLGVSYVTMHANGGLDMLTAGVEGLDEGAANAGLERPIAVAVTVLTSDMGAPQHIVAQRVGIALEAGCGGIVCAGPDLKDIGSLAPDMVRVVPGIRPAGTAANDQARIATPAQAISDGAGLLVIGRAVTLADDPQAAAAAIVAEVRGQD
ncbi:MAG: orotidine-5'-phosphate decarboxylase [Acidimicrobiales bacterium]